MPLLSVFLVFIFAGARLHSMKKNTIAPLNSAGLVNDVAKLSFGESATLRLILSDNAVVRNAAFAFLSTTWLDGFLF